MRLSVKTSTRPATGTGPTVTATLRDAATGYHRTNGDTRIARATRRATAAHTTSAAP
ncbi:hypothetical protein [Micromonospora sp. NPDC092111]|uniref:hypothetical protein n=1 Tax=Micromonospora sp. NPDC092111 TaxID=3364289 RepID=UPI003825C787